MKQIATSAVLFCLFPLSLLLQGQSTPNIHNSTLGESNGKTAEISTEELRRVLAGKSATVFDVRPALEFSISHIPGAVNVAQKPGTSKALYVSDVAEIGRVVGGDKSKPIVLYCNGPFCGKSKRVSEDLLAAGYTNVKRYQLGMPVWRALGGVCQIELEGTRYVAKGDRTSVWLDTRSPAEFAKKSLPGAKRIGFDVAQGARTIPRCSRPRTTAHFPLKITTLASLCLATIQNLSRSLQML